MTNQPIRLAIAGVGNCASSLLQGIEFYKDADPSERVPGLMHVELGARCTVTPRCGTSLNLMVLFCPAKIALLVSMPTLSASTSNAATSWRSRT